MAFELAASAGPVVWNSDTSTGGSGLISTLSVPPRLGVSVNAIAGKLAAAKATVELTKNSRRFKRVIRAGPRDACDHMASPVSGRAHAGVKSIARPAAMANQSLALSIYPFSLYAFSHSWNGEIEAPGVRRAIAGTARSRRSPAIAAPLPARTYPN